jgi:hypothetical protein
MSVAPIEAAFKATAAAQPRPAAKALAQSFKGALAQATKAGSANAETGTADTTAPKGETTKAVAGHGYADILTGPRKDLFLNTSGNKRDGQTFRLVERHGRVFHVYGEGKDRLVVAMRKPDETAKTTVKPTSATSGSFVSNG